MANRKIKFPLWLMPETKATVERLYRQDGCSSQSEFMERAILFYCGYLQSEYAGDFLPKILGETLEAILSMFGDRIGRLLFKQTVEHNVMNHILASDTDIDAATYQCHASYRTIGSAVNMSPNTVRKYVAELVERGLIQTEHTSIITQDGRKQNGSLLYTLLPIQFSIQQFYEQKLAKLDAECEQERIRKRLEAFQQAQQKNACPPA